MNHDYADLKIRAVNGWRHGARREVPHFALSMAERQELARLAQIMDIKAASARIFTQGGAAAHSYLLARGLVRISYMMPDGARQIVAFNWPGDLFGMAEEGHYVHTAETITPSRLYCFPTQKLEQFLLENPKIQDRFLIKITHDLRQTQRQLIVMGRLDVPRRLAAFLLDCAAHEAYFEAASFTLNVPMSRYDIADYLGTSVETVTRALTKFTEQGVVRRLSPRKLVLSTPRLRQIAGLS